MSILSSIPVRDGLVLALVPAARSMLDFSGANRHPTIAGSGLDWINVDGVWQLKAESTGRLVVANDATLEAVTDNSLFVAGSWLAPTAGRIFSKRDADGTQVEVYPDAGTNIEINDGVFGRTASVGSWASVRSWAVTQESGAIADLYTNGAWKSAFNGVSTITADDADVVVLNNWVGNAPQLNSFRALLWYSRVLTADENSQLNTWSNRLFSPYSSPDQRYWDRGSLVPIQEAGQVGAWDLGIVTDLEVADRSENGYHGTLVGGVQTIHTEIGRAMRFGGNGHVTRGPIPIATSGTVEALVIPGSVTGTQYLMAGEDSVGAVRRIGFGLQGDDIRFDYYDGVDVHSISITNVAQIGVPLHPIATWDGSDLKLYIDGDEPTSGTSSIGTNGTAAFTIGARNAGDLFFTGIMASGIVSDSPMSAAEVASKYQQIASTVVFHDDPSQALPSTANRTTGLLDGTEWRIDSGIWAVGEDADGPYYECVGDGDLFWPFLNADNYNADTFEQIAGAPTLTQSAAGLTISAVTGDKVGETILTLA